MSEIRRIGVFTSGGDSPGMNAAIRAVVRTASFYDLHVYGIYRGYEGMIDGEIHRLETSDVANIIQRGGTILKTSRSKGFLTHEGRKKAYDNLMVNDIDGLIAIGGDGTFRGSIVFKNEFNIPTIGLPGTIDNDLFGSDFTIGFDTAVNTAIEAVDKIRDTADSHNRLFLIEVMGRNSGYIAVHTAISSGASAFMIPEKVCSLDDLVQTLDKAMKRKKLFGLVIVAEGNEIGEIDFISKSLKERVPDHEIRVTTIGHLQRGGSPSSNDRILASRLGYHAVVALMEGKTNVMAGIVNDKIMFTPFEESVQKRKTPSDEYIKLAEILGM
ncbi:MAG: 6-phosphofructokinase [Bacteroidota bacterium]|nr:6-phosphofructokinase [Bacteroidota bacterium]